MDENAVIVTIDAGKSLFGLIAINGQLRFIAGNELINSFTHSRYNAKILEMVKEPSKEVFDTTNKEILENEKKRA